MILVKFCSKQRRKKKTAAKNARSGFLLRSIGNVVRRIESGDSNAWHGSCSKGKKNAKCESAERNGREEERANERSLWTLNEKPASCLQKMTHFLFIVLGTYLSYFSHRLANHSVTNHIKLTLTPNATSPNRFRLPFSLLLLPLQIASINANISLHCFLEFSN